MPLKSLIRRFMHKFGYDIVSISKDRDAYVRCYPYTYATYAPWFCDEFLQLYADIAAFTAVKEDRCYLLRQLAAQCLPLEGVYAECGVFKGGSAFLIAHTIQGTGKQLELYDTFEGMPAEAKNDASRHRVGEFGNTSLDAVKAYLDKFEATQFFPDRIPETFDTEQNKRYCFVHVDVDLYQSVHDCCHYFYPRLVPGGVIIFDDYGFLRYRDAAKRAVDEFFSDKPDVLVSFHTGQCMVMKSPGPPS